jgi:excisionase family DNA binding protein
MTMKSDAQVGGPVLERAPVRPAELELPAIGEIASLMMRMDREEPVQRPALVGPHNERIALPDSVYRILREVVEHLRRGESVSILCADEELTTQQAADLLNVSRPYLVRLLDGGEIPSHRVGTHRRVRREDLERYRLMRDQKRRANLRAMVREAEEQGLYDIPEAVAE